MYMWFLAQFFFKPGKSEFRGIIAAIIAVSKRNIEFSFWKFQKEIFTIFHGHKVLLGVEEG